MSQCPKGFICNRTIIINGGSNASCIVNATTLSNPGEYCTNNSQCVSLNCTNNVCIGLSINDPWNSTLFDNNGLYCDLFSSRECLKSSDLGEECTTFGQECGLGLKCSNESICIPYFSQTLGEAGSGVSNIGIDFSCASGFSIMNYSYNYHVYIDAPVSGPLSDCRLGFYYTDSTGIYSNQCNCPFIGYYECPQFQGDYNLPLTINSFNNNFPDWKQCNNGGLTYRFFLGN